MINSTVRTTRPDCSGLFSIRYGTKPLAGWFRFTL